MNINDEKERNIQEFKKIKNEEYFKFIIDKTYEKKMFEKLLNETLEELNKINPCLESNKYHILCLYSNRYNKIIKRINDLIIEYELEELKKLKKQNPYNKWYCYWNWKTMTFNIISDVHNKFSNIYNYLQNEEYYYNEFKKSVYNKKND